MKIKMLTQTHTVNACSETGINFMEHFNKIRIAYVFVCVIFLSRGFWHLDEETGRRNGSSIGKIVLFDDVK